MIAPYIDEWMWYLHSPEGKSLKSMWIFLRDKLPSADLAIFCDQEELLVLAVLLLISCDRDEGPNTWTINLVPISLTNNLRRYKKCGPSG